MMAYRYHPLRGCITQLRIAIDDLWSRQLAPLPILFGRRNGRSGKHRTGLWMAVWGPAFGVAH